MEEEACRGCGTCSATCPSSAITTEHFTNEQIFAMIRAELDEWPWPKEKKTAKELKIVAFYCN